VRTGQSTRAATGFCLLVLVGACSTEPPPDIIAAEGVVRGQVTRAPGIPVPDAWVVLDGLYPLRHGGTQRLYDSTPTDTAGRYSATLGVLNLPDTLVSYSMRIWPPAASGLAPDESEGLGLYLSWQRPDTVVMNIELSP
jgi:hypothetical protein